LKTKKHRLNEERSENNPKELMGMSQNEPQMSQNEPQMSRNEPQMSRNEPVNIQNDIKTYPCDYCEESFSTMANKRRHELHRCKENTSVSNSIITKQEIQIKKLEKEKENQIKKLEKEKENQIKSLEKAMETQKKEMETQKKEMAKHIELLLTKVGNTTINNTQTNNIQLNNYGSEDLTHITDALKTYLLRIPFGAIQRLIEKIHFNKEKPENINLMITNKRDNKISVYEDGKWVYRNKKKTIQRLIDNKYYILDDHYNDIPEEELSDFNHTNYKSFSGKIDENDKQLLEQLYEDVEIIILNKQEKVEN
jgi:hypothetical protein